MIDETQTPTEIPDMGPPAQVGPTPGMLHRWRSFIAQLFPPLLLGAVLAGVGFKEGNAGR